MVQILQCLGDKTGGYDQISNKDALILYCLANGVNIAFAKLIWDDLLMEMKKKHREKVVLYTMFISLLLEHKMQETYKNNEGTPIHTPTFSVNNWELKKGQPKGPPFIAHMLDICNAKGPTEFKAPKPTIQTGELGPVGKKTRAKSGHWKTIPLKTNNPLSKLEVTKGQPLIKEATKTQIGQSKKRKNFVTAKDKNPNQTSVSTHVVTRMHKEDLQVANVQNSLGGTGEVRFDLELSSVESTSKKEPAFSASTIVHSESASGHDASAAFTTEANLGISAPKDSLSQQQGNDDSFNHFIAGTNPSGYIKELFGIESDKDDQRSVGDDDDEIKLEDLTELVKDKDAEAMDLDSPEDDEPI
ncbi:hypothetical protein Tco_1246199 [Tanacetum coccineum]